MKNITIKEIKEELDNFKEQNNINDKHFNILALSELLYSPLFQKFRDYKLYRSHDEEKGFMLYKNGVRLSIWFDHSNNDFQCSHENQVVKGSQLYTDDEIELLKKIVYLFDSENYEEFKEKFLTDFFPKYNVDVGDRILIDLMHKNNNFGGLSMLLAMSDMESKKKNSDGLHINEIAGRILAGIRSAVPMFDKFSQVEALSSLLDNETIEDKMNMNAYRRIVNVYENYSNDDDSEGDYSKIKTLLENERFVKGTLTGCILTAKTIDEIIENMLKNNFEALKESFIAIYEFPSMLKSEETIVNNLKIPDFIKSIKRKYPIINQDPNDSFKSSIELGEFSNDRAESGKQYGEYIDNFEKFGLISPTVYMSAIDVEIDIDLFHKESYEKDKKLIFKGENATETVYQYVFKENDYFGTKVIDPKGIYIARYQSEIDFNNSLRQITDYVIANDCIIRPSVDIDDHLLLCDYKDFLDNHYPNQVLYLDVGDEFEREVFNYCLMIKKTCGDKAKFQDLKDFVKKVEENGMYSNKSVKDIYDTFETKIMKRKLKTGLKNGPN